jgi:uncharacterized protein (DUF3820 family)
LAKAHVITVDKKLIEKKIILETNILVFANKSNMKKFKWNLSWPLDNVFIQSNQWIPVTYGIEPIGLCKIEVLDKKYYIGHFELTRELDGHEYLLWFFEKGTPNGNELKRIEISPLFTPNSDKTVVDMDNEVGIDRKSYLV